MSDVISTAEALQLREYAAHNRKHAEKIREQDPDGALVWLATAEDQERQANARLAVETLPSAGTAGEFVLDDKTMPALLSRQQPDAITVEGSRERLQLLERAGSHDLALELVQNTKPRSSREKLLAHGEATLHAHAMKLIAKANQQSDPVEIARLTNAACKCFAVAQEAALVITKLRGGGSQKVEVRHVHVHPGGQAIVGNVGTGKPRRGRKSKS